jgi:DNA polymerase III alpha subunit
VGLGAIRSLTAEVAQATVEERVRGGPYLGLGDFRRRVATAPQDLALLIRAGCFDCTGKGRQVLLREAEAPRLGRLPAWWEGRDEYEPWPFEGLLAEYALAVQWRDEWELLGFLACPSLMALVRAVLTPALADSRALAARVGKRVRLAGVVAAAKETSGERHNLTLEDEWGLIEVQAPAQGEEGAPGPVLLVEGEVQERADAPLVVASRLERPLPGPLHARVEPGVNGAPVPKKQERP